MKKVICFVLGFSLVIGFMNIVAGCSQTAPLGVASRYAAASALLGVASRCLCSARRSVSLLCSARRSVSLRRRC